MRASVPGGAADILSLPKPATVAAAEYIRHQVFFGHYQPNTRVPQDEVALALNISRIPIREALVTLDNEGYVRLEANRGAMVLPFYAEDLRSYFKMRAFAQALAAQRCAELSEQACIESLQEISGQMSVCDSPKEFSKLVEEFNRVIGDSGTLPRLKAVIARFRNIVPGDFYSEVPGTMEVEKANARRVLAAIERNDCEDVMASYLERAREHAERLIALLRSRGQIVEDPIGAN